MIYGITDRVYKVYGTLDNYYVRNPKHSVHAYHRDYRKKGDHSAMVDPFLRGIRTLDEPIWDSREYFLSIWATHLNRAVQEWDGVTTVLKEAVQRK